MRGKAGSPLGIYLIMLKTKRLKLRVLMTYSVVICRVKEAEVDDFQKTMRGGLKDFWLHSLCE